MIWAIALVMGLLVSMWRGKKVALKEIKKQEDAKQAESELKTESEPSESMSDPKGKPTKRPI